MKRHMRRLLSVLLCLVLLIGVMPTASASNSEGITYTATLDSATLSQSASAQTVVMTVAANQTVDCDTLQMAVTIPSGWTLAAITNPDLGPVSGGVDVGSGLVSWYTTDAENDPINTIIQVTYNVPANAAKGTYTLGITGLNISKDYGTPWEEGGSVTATLEIVCPHDWAPADCDTPKTCNTCGETEGAANGHDWAPADCDTPKTCNTCGATEGAANGHDWAPADCDTPKTCNTCGATEGAANGHDWAPADCDTPKTCNTCGATEGAANGHDWAPADCENPKTCNTCGATEGTANGHDWSAWSETLAPTEFDLGTEARECNTCGKDEERDVAALGHTHTPEKTAAVDPTCTTDGNIEYYVCTNARCAMWFEDATCNIQITDKDSVNREMLGHDYTEQIKDADHLRSEAANCQEFDTHWYDCSRCDANAKNDAEATDKWYNGEAGEHSYDMENWGHTCEDGHAHKCEFCSDYIGETEHVPGPEATEEDPQICTECEYVLVPALGHTHNLTETPAKDATCTEDGNKAYYTCSGCEEWFEDALGTVVIEDKESVVIPAGHTESDWVYDEDNHWKECTVEDCKVEIEDTKAAHADENKDAKCDTCGYAMPLPNTPTDPNGTTDTTDTPKTGDSSTMLLWAAMMLIGLCGIFAAAMPTKKSSVK